VDVLEIDAAATGASTRCASSGAGPLPARPLRSKVYIIDEAHMLTSEAWNAFLKTLEEPPLTSSSSSARRAHKVPDTCALGFSALTSDGCPALGSTSTYG